jgi:hypothetical protein
MHPEGLAQLLGLRETWVIGKYYLVMVFKAMQHDYKETEDYRRAEKKVGSCWSPKPSCPPHLVNGVFPLFHPLAGRCGKFVLAEMSLQVDTSTSQCSPLQVLCPQCNHRHYLTQRCLLSLSPDSSSNMIQLPKGTIALRDHSEQTISVRHHTN